MRFSIVVAVYNCEKHLSQCIDSILSQDFNDYEIVLVDDGSKDESPTMCDEYAKRYSQIKVTHKENGGPHSARKTGVSNSTGDYIVTIDSDDCMTKGFLSYFDKEITKYDNPDCVMFGCTYYDENLKNPIKKQKNLIDAKLYSGDEIKTLENVLLYNKKTAGINFGSLLFSLCTKVVKRNVLYKSMSLCDENIRYGEDLITSKYIFKHLENNSILVSDYCGYMYRQNETSLTHINSISKIKHYANTVDGLELSFSDEPNKVSVFAFQALTGIYYSAAKQASCFNEYKKQIKTTYAYEKIYRYASLIKISKRSVKDSLKILVVNRKLLFVSYMYFKYYLK